MQDRSLTIPDVEPGGLTLLWAPPRSTALHRVALAALADCDGTALWVDARDTASTAVLFDLAPRSTLRRLRIARSWTAYQHHELVRRLPAAVDARTDLVIAPAICSLYEDDDVPSPEDRTYLASTLAVLDELSRAAGLRVLVGADPGGAFAGLAAEFAGAEIEFEATPLGHRFVADGFETTVYWGDGFWQTTIPYWVELLGAVGEAAGPSAYDAGLVDAEV